MVHLFKDSQLSGKDSRHSGKPSMSKKYRNRENSKVRQLVVEDYGNKIRDIESKLGILFGSV